MAHSVRRFKETMELQAGLLTRIRQHRHFRMGLMFAALIVVACLHIWQRVHVISLVQQVGALRAESAQMVDETKKAKIEIASLSRGTRIGTAAAESLGLQLISADRLYTIDLQMDRTTPIDTTGELAAVVSSIKRVADYLPIMSEARAGSGELRPIKFDSIASREDIR